MYPVLLVLLEEVAVNPALDRELRVAEVEEEGTVMTIVDWVAAAEGVVAVFASPIHGIRPLTD